jgi:adenosylcobinamide kinase/adenosylcobinamide-phosphate guanylyltransferase
VVQRSHLILGGARSGKSRFALAQARALARPTAFVATAPTHDPSLRARIARHQAERPPGWLTVEEPIELVGACRRLARQCELVIVDCVTLWISNLILRGDPDETVAAAVDGLAKLLQERLVSMILVSNEVGAGVHPPTAVGLRFADLLGLANQHLAAAADQVTLMVAGIPVTVKDTPPSERLHADTPEAP